MTSPLPTRTPAPPPAAMAPPAPEAPVIDGALILAVLTSASTPRDGMSTPQINCRMDELGLGTMPLAELGCALEILRADGLVGRHRPPTRTREPGCPPRRYWATAEGRARVGADEPGAGHD